MLRLIDAGILNKVLKDVVRSTSGQLPYVRPKLRVDQPLTFDQLQTAFYLLVGGLILAGVGFLAEAKFLKRPNFVM